MHVVTAVAQRRHAIMCHFSTFLNCDVIIISLKLAFMPLFWMGAAILWRDVILSLYRRIQMILLSFSELHLTVS